DRIERVKAWRLSLPLIRPYHLSLGAIEAFDTILIEASDGQRTGLGEATYLTGYTDETVDDAWDKVEELSVLVAGKTIDAARERLGLLLVDAPFTVTAFVTAFDMLQGNALLRVDEPARVPLLTLLGAETEDEIEREIAAAIERGFSTLKIKVGFDVDADLRRVATIQRVNRGRCALRLDANQGYSRDEAIHFSTKLDPSAIELFEQPCDKSDWDSAVAVAGVSQVPMMLDESIYGADDIKRAAQFGAARYVKLKLMKAGSLDTLARDLTEIRTLGMEPVLGNGVAVDVSNWMEACVARGRVTNALESNGFLKPRRSILQTPLRFENGSIVLEPGWTPVLDLAAIEAQSAAQIECRA
ncbi:MAG TPA: enolase C-terminal domain-like protein, partial [Candidatus Acidoferrales bacterium]|nr:enolase C-terminal domain-like protein [Candidatus Acidoferrales bacterium]